MKDFDEIYASIINTNQTLEEKYNIVKNKDKKVSKYCNLAIIIIGILGLVLIFKTKAYMFSAFFIVSLIVIRIFLKFIVGSIIGLNFDNREINIEYKENVVSKIINGIFKDNIYLPDAKLDKNLYKSAEFEFFDNYYSDDYIEINLDNNLIKISNIKTESVSHDSEGHTHTSVEFSGLFSVVNLKKNTKLNLKIMSSYYEYIKDKIKLDNPIFEKYFNVSSNDSVKTYSILTSIEMDYLINLREKLNMNIDIYINGDILYLRFHSGSTFDINDYNGDILNRELLEKYYVILSTIKELVTKINTL